MSGIYFTEEHILFRESLKLSEDSMEEMSGGWLFQSIMVLGKKVC